MALAVLLRRHAGLAPEEPVKIFDAAEAGALGGDADGDGTLTLGDALAIMRTAIGVAPEFGDNIGDMNANGEINLDDAITLARICIGVY